VLPRNNGGKGQYQCKVCHTLFSPEKNRFHKSYELRCPFCGHALVPVKNRKFFVIWKCVNSRCPYYADRLKKVRADSPNGKSDYKLHYIYREFSVDFFRMELGGPSRKIASMRFRKYDANVMGLCLTLRVNLQLSLRQTSQALQDLYGFRVSHQQIANYCRLAALCVKPFVDSYQYHPGSSLVADETYIKIRGIRSYIWLIMDSVSRSILGYRVSGDRTVGPCIMAMRMAFRHFRDGLPKDFRFIADGYSAYPLAAQQFFREFGERMRFEITQVIGLRNGDAVTTEFRPFKQLIERLNRTYKSSYRTTNGYDGMDGADCDLVLWVAYARTLTTGIRTLPQSGFRIRFYSDHIALLQAVGIYAQVQLRCSDIDGRQGSVFSRCHGRVIDAVKDRSVLEIIRRCIFSGEFHRLSFFQRDDIGIRILQVYICRIVQAD
jgi:transposase-like protein